MELYTHLDIMRSFAHDMKQWGCSIVAVFVVDATFVTDPAKFISGSLLSLSCMLQLELPHINILSKCDLVSESEINAILDTQSASAIPLGQSSNSKLNTLTMSIQELIDDFSQVSFLPLNIREEDSIALVLAHADHALQYGENADVIVRDHEGPDGFE